MPMQSTSPIPKLFGKSPFKPLQEHMRTVTQTVELLPAILKALSNQDKPEVEKLVQEIITLENKADDFKDELRTYLHRKMFLPVDRRDLLQLLNAQEAIVDGVQDIAGILQRRFLVPPENLEQGLLDLANRSLEVCLFADKTIKELDSLIELGFETQELGKILGMLGELSELESAVDKMDLALAQELFATTDQRDPVDTYLWYKIIEMTSSVADNAKRAGDRMRMFFIP
ncbi:MAG: TIGR00153 family protein [Magnetococcales bacterium]|nr:TIGR00153 family protein [Magnetococcales bacterium]